MFIKNSSLFLIKKPQAIKINKKSIKKIKNFKLFFMFRSYKNKKNKNMKIFKKNLFSSTFLKFFLTNRKNKFQAYRTLIFFKFLPLLLQSKVLKKTKIKKIKINSDQIFFFIKKNNLNYKKRFKNKRLNFRKIPSSARFFFLKRKKKLYKQKGLFFSKSNHFISKYHSLNFLLKKKNYFNDFFFFPFYRFQKINFINHKVVQKKISFFHDFFFFTLFNDFFLNEKIKIFFLLKKKNPFLLNFFNVCNLFVFENFLFKHSFLKKKNSFLKKKNSFLKKKNSFFLFFSVVSSFPYYFKTFNFFENQVKIKNLFFFFRSSFFKKNFRKPQSSSFLDRLNVYSSLYFFKKLFFSLPLKFFFFFNYTSAQHSIFRLINNKFCSKIFFFFLKKKKMEISKKKKFFYFNFWKKSSASISSKKKNTNFFLKNNLLLFSFRPNYLFNLLNTPSTFFYDIFFFFSNPFYFKSYNFFFFNTFANTSFLLWYSLLTKKNFNKNFTNLLTDSSLFTFSICRQITQTLEYQKIKSFFAYLPYNTLIKFIEYTTGKKVALKINPFIFRSLSLNDNTRCLTWAQRVKVFRKNLGPRLFLLESLQIITLSFRLQDPYILSNWMLSMFYKISFWKYKMLLRYLQYILRNFFWPYFSEYKIKGLKFQLKGKVSVAGNARTRTVFTQIGSLSHSTARYKVLTNLNLLRTFTGVIGFRTWLVF